MIGPTYVDHRIDLERVRSALARQPAGSTTGPDLAPAAAVATSLREQSGGAEVLLIRRVARQGDPWSGQMGLPGGRRHAGDRDLLATATRETREEAAVDNTRAAR